MRLCDQPWDAIFDRAFDPYFDISEFFLFFLRWNLCPFLYKQLAQGVLHTTFACESREDRNYGAVNCCCRVIQPSWKTFQQVPLGVRDRGLSFASLYVLNKLRWLTFGLRSRAAWTQLGSTRWSGDVMKWPGSRNFNAVSHNCSRPEVFFNLTWRSRGQISSVLLQLLLFAFSNRKFGRHGKWSVSFWQWENNT